jgi:hypothetical protein
MNVDEIQKINMLAKELQKHGMAASSQEAVQQAQKIMQEKQEEQVKVPVPAPQQPQIDYLTQKKIELLVTMSTKKMQEEINTLQQIVSVLRIDLEKAKVDIASMRRTSVQVPAMPKKEAAPTPIPQQAPQPKKKANPRQGQFTSADVDLKKMFYYGR